jgi:hypothetical protein
MEKRSSDTCRCVASSHILPYIGVESVTKSVTAMLIGPNELKEFDIAKAGIAE